MTRASLGKLRRQIAALRAGTPNVGQLQRLARKLGRKLDGSHGKEPTWTMRGELAGRRPLAIPDHGSMPRPTAQGIVDDLESDLFAWEELLNQREQEQKARGKKP